MLHPRRVQQARVWVRSTAPLRGLFVSAGGITIMIHLQERLALHNPEFNSIFTIFTSAWHFIIPSSTQSSPSGRGRGGDINRPAWMSNGPVAAGATTAVGAAEGGTAARETRATTLTSAVAAGRGRGRGANIIAAGMAKGGHGPRAAQAAAGSDAEAAVGAATGEAAEGVAAGVIPSAEWERMSRSQRKNWLSRNR